MEVVLSADGFKIGPELSKYAKRKAAQIEKRIVRKFREQAHCVAKFTLVESAGGKESTCALTLVVMDVTYQSTETTEHMYAALDIASAHISQQLVEARKQAKANKPRRRIRGRLRADS